MASTKRPGAVASAERQGNCASTPPARPANSSETRLDQLPILIGEFEANTREKARVILEHYRGHDLVYLSKWYPGRDGDLLPGKNAFAVNVRHLRRLHELIGLALAKAIEIGLVDGAIDDCDHGPHDLNSTHGRAT
jgi:hypothetical protein